MFSYRCFVSDVEVKHPYEPVRCKPVKCDYYIFRDNSFGSVDGLENIIINFLFNKLSNDFLFHTAGIVIVPKYYDKSLNFYSYLEIFDVSADMIDFISKTLN